MLNNSTIKNNTSVNDSFYYDGSIDLKEYFSKPMVAIQITLSALILGSNGFFLVVFIKRKSLRAKPSNILLLSFAFCDTLFGVLIVLHVTSVFVADYTLSSRTIELQYLVILDILGNAVNCCSVFHLGLIAGERFLSLFAPLRHLVAVTRKRVILSLIGIWTLAFCFPWFELCYLYRVLDGNISKEDSVVLSKSQPIYSVFSWAVFTLLPMILLAIIYTKMLLQIRKSLKNKEKKQHGLQRSSSQGTGRKQSDSKAIGIFVCMYIMFFALSMPYFAARIILDSGKLLHINVESIPPSLLKAFYCLRCLVSFLNPLLYTGWKTDVRQEVFILCSIRKHHLSSGTKTSKIDLKKGSKPYKGCNKTSSSKLLKGEYELVDISSIQRNDQETGNLIQEKAGENSFK